MLSKKDVFFEITLFLVFVLCGGWLGFIAYLLLMIVFDMFSRVLPYDPDELLINPSAAARSPRLVCTKDGITTYGGKK